MRAIVTTGHDDLTVIDLPVPTPRPDQILVRVTAAGLNPVDITTRRGGFHAAGLIDQPATTGLGWDVAGTVAALGADVDGPAIGTPVAGLNDNLNLPVRGHAEYVLLPAAAVTAIPEGVTPQVAAAVALNGLAAAQALDLLDPSSGIDLLITGAAGAVGGFAVQLATRRGWRVTALAREADREFLTGIGASVVISEPAGSYDAVIDTAVLDGAALALVRDGGGYVGVLPGATPAAERGIVPVAVMTGHDGPVVGALLDLVAAGDLTVRIAETFPLAEAAQAHDLFEKGGHRGQFLLTP